VNAQELLELRDELEDAARYADAGHEYEDRLGLVPVTHESWVYLVRAVGTDFVKVGFTSAAEPASRVSELQTGNPHELRLEDRFAGDMSMEGAVHATIKHRHVRGEWFQLRQDETAAIAEAGWQGYVPFVCTLCEGIRSRGLNSGLCYDCDLAIKRDVETVSTLSDFAVAADNSDLHWMADAARGLLRSRAALDCASPHATCRAFRVAANRLLNELDAATDSKFRDGIRRVVPWWGWA
jgi:hypothetical protein